LYLDMTLEGGVVDGDMIEFVRVFVDHCRQFQNDPQTETWVERRFNLAALHPPGAMFGTADFVAYDRVNAVLHVVDLKYGAGVVVEAVGNKQLRYYALGAALSFDPPMPISEVVMTIVQPRVGHPDGVIRSDTISYLDLVGFAAELMEAARATLAPDAPLHAGSHCRFCPASGVCPEQREHALAVAQNEFSVVADVPPAPETMPIEMIAEMLPKLHILEDWIKAVRGHVLAKLEHGEDVPGYKLVAKRATRKWTDPAGAEQYLAAEGFDPDEFQEPREIKSVAQIEKLLGKKAFAASPLSAAVAKISSGYNVAPASDPRPAVSVTAGEEFALLPPAADE
jgi:hypothetical protein